MKEKKRIRTDNDRKADRKYNEKRMNFAISYTPTDILDGKRLKQYLIDCNLTANSYIKQLIKSDLDTKGIDYPSDTD